MTHLPWLVGTTVAGGATVLVAVGEVVTAGLVGALGAAGVVGAVFVIVTGTALWVWMLELTLAVFAA